MEPGYIKLLESGELENRIRRAQTRMNACDLCPRLCRVNRTGGEFGFCATGRHAILASSGPHFGEEAPLVGSRGSGTIFVSSCNLGCDFCQNDDISHHKLGREVTADEWAALMLDLQSKGCHNLNIVSPSHVVPALLEALEVAARNQLRLPLVYNTGGYDCARTLRLLDGIVDIYMPDFKFWDGTASTRYCDAADYPARAREAIKEMHRQVGDLEIGPDGVARKGLLVRHLVLPEAQAGTREICEYLCREISSETYVNIMDQYRPAGRVEELGPLERRITREEYDHALADARSAGLTRLDQRGA